MKGDAARKARRAEYLKELERNREKISPILEEVESNARFVTEGSATVEIEGGRVFAANPALIREIVYVREVNDNLILRQQFLDGPPEGGTVWRPVFTVSHDGEIKLTDFLNTSVTRKSLENLLKLFRSAYTPGERFYSVPLAPNTTVN